jgi:hypothetical protein
MEEAQINQLSHIQYCCDGLTVAVERCEQWGLRIEIPRRRLQ